ncbi:MAG: GDP-mannose 4,6-dehydratase [Myxococcota bacterium]
MKPAYLERSASSEPRTAVVTGGAGFIGSHLVEALLRCNDRVRVLDNLATGRLDNLEHLKNDPRLSVEIADIRESQQVARCFVGADVVFHLAALADIVPSIENPTEYLGSNFSGTVAVLEASRNAGVPRFVYAASSSCYGIAEVHPTPESAACAPQYPYALSKYLGEQATMHWHQVYDLSVASLRLFNVYGPRSRTHGTYGAMFGVFLAQKLADAPFTVVGDGKQSRDFTYVSDVVDAFLAAGASDKIGIWNVGTGTPTSVSRIVELLAGPVVSIPKRPGEPDCTQADTTAIHRDLGWESKVSIEAGVANLLEHIDYWREAPVWTPESIAEATRQWFSHLGSSK